MAMLRLVFGDVIARVARFLYDTWTPSGWEGTNPSTDNYQVSKEIVLDGYQRFLSDHPWAFLNKSTTMTAYSTVTGTTTGLPTAKTTTTGTTIATASTPAYYWPHSTIVALTSIFSESMVGDPMAIAGVVAGTYYIDEYINGTTVKVIGDASGEGVSKGITVTHRVPYSVVTATAAKFFPSMVGQAFKFDTSETEYTIYKYVSSTVVWVLGDASGETSGDTFTMTPDGNYALPDDFGMLISSFSYDSTNPFPAPYERTPEFLQGRRSLQSATTGYPMYFAVRPNPQSPLYRDSAQIMFQPTPSTNQTFYYEYQIDPVQPENYTDIFLGGPKHNMTILQACFAQVEIHRGDTEGPQNKMYKNTHLPRSIRVDFDKRPRNLGPVRGRSDRYDSQGDYRRTEVIHTLTS